MGENDAAHAHEQPSYFLTHCDRKAIYTFMKHDYGHKPHCAHKQSDEEDFVLQTTVQEKRREAAAASGKHANTNPNMWTNLCTPCAMCMCILDSKFLACTCAVLFIRMECMYL
jgi:hypothetical protein